MSKLEIIVILIVKLWVWLPLIYVAYHFIKGLIKKEFMDIVVGLIALAGYLAFLLLIYLIGDTTLEYMYLGVVMLKTVMPIFVIFLTEDFKERCYFDMEKWGYIYGMFFLFILIEKIFPIIIEKYKF